MTTKSKVPEKINLCYKSKNVTARLNPLSQVRPIAKRSSDKVEVVLLDELLRDAEKQSAAAGDDHVQKKDGSEAAMIIYTSGTTGPPKGVVLTADNVRGSASYIENQTQRL